MSERSQPNDVSESAKLKQEARDTAAQPRNALETPRSEASGASGVEKTGESSAPSPSGPPLAGQGFEDFELLEEVGRGGMGVVYRARQKSLERIVALKMLHGEYFEDSAARARFLAEARAIASLGHPNIVNVFQVGQCDTGYFFAMEFINGHSLATLLEQGPMPIQRTVALLIHVADAVDYAHTKGVIHRDLKPANIMIDEFGRPIVMDFGIAKVDQTTDLTKEGDLMGTPSFMSPEQADRGWGQVGPPSDVYSLGAILFTALTGQGPFDTGSVLSTIVKVVSPDPPQPLRVLRPEVPRELERVCMKCLKKRPADRYATARALGQDLRRFRASFSETPPKRPATLPALALVSLKTGREIRVSKAITVFGRGSECDVVLQASDVSRQHCRILLETGKVLVEDLKSGNGTYVNGLAVQRSLLEDGDKLHIARHAFQIHLRCSAS